MSVPCDHPSFSEASSIFLLLTSVHSNVSWLIIVNLSKSLQWVFISFLNVPGVSLMARRSRGVEKLQDPPLLLCLCWSLLLQDPPLCLQVALVTCVISLHTNLRCIPQCHVNVSLVLLSPVTCPVPKVGRGVSACPLGVPMPSDGTLRYFWVSGLILNRWKFWPLKGKIANISSQFTLKIMESKVVKRKKQVILTEDLSSLFFPPMTDHAMFSTGMWGSRDTVFVNFLYNVIIFFFKKRNGPVHRHGSLGNGFWNQCLDFKYKLNLGYSP